MNTFPLLFELGALKFHFTLSSTDYVAGSAIIIIIIINRSGLGLQVEKSLMKLEITLQSYYSDQETISYLELSTIPIL